jgi:hypothetical protein
MVCWTFPRGDKQALKEIFVFCGLLVIIKAENNHLLNASLGLINMPKNE